MTRKQARRKDRPDAFERWLETQLDIAHEFGTLRAAWYRQAYRRALSEYRAFKQRKKK